MSVILCYWSIRKGNTRINMFGPSDTILPLSFCSWLYVDGKGTQGNTKNVYQCQFSITSFNAVCSKPLGKLITGGCEVMNKNNSNICAPRVATLSPEICKPILLNRICNPIIVNTQSFGPFTTSGFNLEHQDIIQLAWQPFDILTNSIWWQSINAIPETYLNSINLLGTYLNTYKGCVAIYEPT